MTRQIWVSPDKATGRTRVHKPEAERDLGHFETQKEAIDYAREVAINQRLEMIVQRRDGTIRLRNTYFEPDPHPPRG